MPLAAGGMPLSRALQGGAAPAPASGGQPQPQLSSEAAFSSKGQGDQARSVAGTVTGLGERESSSASSVYLKKSGLFNAKIDVPTSSVRAAAAPDPIKGDSKSKSGAGTTRGRGRGRGGGS